MYFVEVHNKIKFKKLLGAQGEKYVPYEESYISFHVGKTLKDAENIMAVHINYLRDLGVSHIVNNLITKYGETIKQEQYPNEIITYIRLPKEVWEKIIEIIEKARQQPYKLLEQKLQEENKLKLKT
ncbi:MAG: hypothetical protein GXO43_06910 [Crenarchaeota archaeon]|nr:hypothetical protein [Thermoproteota archaeon]